jgi:sporulation protein YlmC with PRC-barrel domain
MKKVMENNIEYGFEVMDRNGEALGTVDYIIRNTWTGEVSKFMVRRKPPEEDLFFSPKDILEVAESRIRISNSLGELIDNARVAYERRRVA